MFLGVRPLLVLVVGILLTTLVFPASAAPPGPDILPVHVVAVKSDAALDQAEALTVALRKAVRSSEGWSLGASEQSLEFLALKMKCNEPIDASCEGRIAEVLKADRYLWAVIEFDGADKSKVKGSLNFFVRGKGTSRHALDYSANLTDATADALILVAKNAVEAVTGGAPSGSLKVATGGVAGQIFIDDEPMGALTADGGTYELKAGDHRVVVKATGYEDAEGTATVKPSKEVELTLTLVALPEETPLDGRLIGGIAVLAVGAGAGAVGLWAGLSTLDLNSDPQWEESQKVNSQDICADAEAGKFQMTPGGFDMNGIIDHCDKGSTFELLQAIMYPVAGVAAGVGLYLILTSSAVSGDDDGADSAFLDRVQVVPVVTPDTQAIMLQYQF